MNPEIYHPDVKLGGEFSIFYPDWSKELTIPNGASEQKIHELIASHTEKLLNQERRVMSQTPNPAKQKRHYYMVAAHIIFTVDEDLHAVNLNCLHENKTKELTAEDLRAVTVAAQIQFMKI